MNRKDQWLAWETYAYRAAYFIVGEEREALELAGRALLSARGRLASTKSREEAEAVIKRAVLRQSVPVICAHLADATDKLA